jgi:hypothetical protein
MPLAFVMVDNAALREAVAARLELKFGYCVLQRPFLGESRPEATGEHFGAAWIVDHFNSLASWMEGSARDRGGITALRNALAVVRVDRPGEKYAGPVTDLTHPDAPAVTTLISLLILAFPEVHWALSQADSKTWKDLITDRHAWGDETSLDTPAEFNRAGISPLFDPTGLRNALRQRVLENCNTSPRPLRRKLAISIDEEVDYTYFNAYAAYRTGRKAWTAVSFRALREFDSADSPLPAGGLGGSLDVMQDLYLNFADRPAVWPASCDVSAIPSEEQRFSNLRFLDLLCGRLKASTSRFLVTVGHQRGADMLTLWRSNLQYLSASSAKWGVIYKPVAGLHRLARLTGLLSKDMSQRSQSRKIRQEPGPHSAPGRILLVANLLVDRARQVIAEATTVQDAIHSAVLALDAKELLGQRTPTVALEAIGLQHEAEVTAESLFEGVRYNLDLKDRIHELETEIADVSQWFGRSRSKRAALNASLTVVERLAARFRGLNQLEEEMACLAEARKLRFDFWMRERPLRWALWPFLRYISFALSSLPRFAGVLVAWIVIFWIGHHLFAWKISHYDPFGCLSSAAFFTFTLQLPNNWSNFFSGHGGWETFWNLFLAFQGAVSFINLGLLLSHLYMIASRR